MSLAAELFVRIAEHTDSEFYGFVGVDAETIAELKKELGDRLEYKTITFVPIEVLSAMPEESRTLQ